jgi:hypothetical protein
VALVSVSGREEVSVLGQLTSNHALGHIRRNPVKERKVSFSGGMAWAVSSGHISGTPWCHGNGIGAILNV